ncbi:GNAT family N-acetyltransferase [uncultured Roseovarius sp.]|uniref:GNAT family N-acetyltransferase n=1 Tax=uncultured Roseovarius sp. TaxID=293344 RepID=UPI00261EE849|nr:GNAT family N-acetyltransferase [uncultured Roseovarius sp.]
MTVATLKTQRFVLRELATDDLEALQRIVGDFEVSKWLVPVPHPYTRDDAEDFLHKVRQGGEGNLWAIEHEATFVGLIGIEPSLGYWLCPSVWGRGLMTEAVQMVVDRFFDHSDHTQIQSCYFEGNTGSKRVLEKVGFVDIGPGTSFSMARQAEVSSRRMQLTRARWSSLRAGAI